MATLELLLANRILKNSRFRQEMAALRAFETERKFCRHDLEHCLSVARLTMLLCFQKNISVEPDVIYAAALLHDLGRVAEYTDGTPHQLAGKALAEEILTECECSASQKEHILRLIASHREKAAEDPAEALFYQADKKSRSCFACPARQECNWPPEKRTMEIEE